MGKTLPSHLLKLRWLNSQIEKLSFEDAEFVKDLVMMFSDSKMDCTDPLLIDMLNELYASQKHALKGVLCA